MKAWKKGAVIGGLWGLISVLKNPGSAVYYTFYEKIAFFPYYFEMTVIYGSPLGIINYAPPIALLFVILEGALIGSIIGLTIEKYRMQRQTE